VVDLNDTRPGPAWISIAAHKNGTPSARCLVRNNLSTDLRIDGREMTVDHNTVIRVSDLVSYFRNPAAFDFRLRAGVAVIDSGVAAAAPARDILGIERPQGRGVDPGAYEFTGADAAANTALEPTRPPSALPVGHENP